MTFPVEVKVESSAGLESFECESVNVSKAALEVLGDGALVAAFLAQETYPHFCRLRFSLPGSGEQWAAECQLLVYRRLSQHRYQYVFLFGAFEAGSQESLVRHLEGRSGSALMQVQPG